MSLRRKIAIGVVMTIFGVAAYIAYAIIYTVRRLPEAYAAWDTGTLLVEYMKSHGNRWPSSWDDLVTMAPSESADRIILHGAAAGGTNYVSSLRTKVAISWEFDPSREGQGSPVTRPDGRRFPVVWSGAEPNAMVYSYLRASRTNPPGGR